MNKSQYMLTKLFPNLHIHVHGRNNNMNVLRVLSMYKFRVREIAYGFGGPSEKNVSPH